MQKNLFLFTAVCALLIAGILGCAGWLIYQLLRPAPAQPEILTNARLVWEVIQDASQI